MTRPIIAACAAAALAATGLLVYKTWHWMWDGPLVEWVMRGEDE